MASTERSRTNPTPDDLREITLGHGARDYGLVLGKMTLSAVPVWGSSLAALLDAIPTHWQNSIERLLSKLRDRLVTLECKEQHSVRKEEFTELYHLCTVAAARTTRDEKLEAAAAILANLFLPESDNRKLSFTELDLFARALDALSMEAIVVLGRAHKVVLEKHIPCDNNGAYPISLGQLKERCNEVTTPLLLGLVGELGVYSFLRQPSFQFIQSENRDLTPLELTRLGCKFVDYLLEPNNDNRG